MSDLTSNIWPFFPGNLFLFRSETADEGAAPDPDVQQRDSRLDPGLSPGGAKN